MSANLAKLQLTSLLAHPPRNLRGEEADMLIEIDGERIVFYFARAFRDAEDYKRMMAEEGIVWREKFTVYERRGGRWLPLCGSWRA